MKLTIIGAHGIGKTTLAFHIATKKKLEGDSVKFIGETARDCPFGVNEKMTDETVLWIYHRQMQRELEAESKYDTVICDRSVIDSFIYGISKGIHPWDNSRMDACYQAAKEWMRSYDAIVYVKRSLHDIFDDGVRDTDKEWQRRVEECFDDYISENRRFLRLHECSSQDIFKALEKDQS